MHFFFFAWFARFVAAMILSFDDDHSLRPGADQFFNMTKDKGVPVLILSAGLGGMWYFETFIVISVIWSF